MTCPRVAAAGLIHAADTGIEPLKKHDEVLMLGVFRDTTLQVSA